LTRSSLKVNYRAGPSDTTPLVATELSRVIIGGQVE
jgi:hypothetical protein